jgi:hypothetical protein
MGEICSKEKHLPVFAPSLDRLVVLRNGLTIPKAEDKATFLGCRMISTLTECLNDTGEVGACVQKRVTC